MIAAHAPPDDGIAATLAHTDAAATVWDAVVVGAGPAGAAAAMGLAARGVRVLLVDRAAMPRAKVCGSCLSPAALDELARLAACVGDDAKRPPGAAALGAVRLAARGTCVRLPMPGGAVISRETLDPWLARRAITAGAHWLPRTSVAAIAADAHGPAPLVLATADDPRSPPVTIRTSVCVLAAGLSGHVKIAGATRPAAASAVPHGRIGVGAVLGCDAARLPAGELMMAVARGGYCGLVRLEDGRIDIAAALDPRAVAAAGPAQAVLDVLCESGAIAAAEVDRQALAATTFQATPRLTRALPPVADAAGRIFRIGDAAGYVEPFTGEGIGWALASARLLVDALVATDGHALAGPPDRVAAAYAAAHRSHFAPRHARCRRVARGLRMPAVVAATMQAARLAPWVAGRLVPLLVGATGTGATGR
jgi:menaquinone-9 beta-reductase